MEFHTNLHILKNDNYHYRYLSIQDECGDHGKVVLNLPGCWKLVVQKEWHRLVWVLPN